MFKIAKEFSFDMAHMLDGHDGKCKNLHGHTYTLQVEIAGELHTGGAKSGMVMDYSDLKAVVKQHILDKMDHAFILDFTREKELQVAPLPPTLDSKNFCLSCRSPAEQMAKYIFDTLTTEGLPVSLIRLWETPTSYCEYCR
ncbi:6-carboxytetrahydropterin synthase QueD [Glaesserella parasuis]|nr:6-carboxytetrahydropterin synthase QueD [Glaesserella parasuis]